MVGSRIKTSVVSVVIGVLGFVLCLQGAFASVDAQLDRDTIYINETVQLVIQTDEIANSVRPDLSPLEKNFSLLGTSVNQNISIINGQQVAEKKWVTELEPKAVGSFTIPSIQVGSEMTRPLRLTVLPEDPANSVSGRDIMVELEVSPSEIFVQQQAVITVRLFLGVNLLDGSLTDPEPGNTDVRRLGKDTQFSTTISGREYRVVERKYAIFPRASGELQIPAIRFQGLSQDSASGSRVFSNLFNQGTRISAKSNSGKIMVKPPHPSFNGREWLPAGELVIEEISNVLDQAQLGQPITRQIQIRATGLAAEQLPELVFPQSSNYRMYPERPVLKSGTDGQNITSSLTQSIAFIASIPGEISMPGLEINWWNTQLNKVETTVLPEIKLNVTEAIPDQPPEARLLVDSATADQQSTPLRQSKNAMDAFWRWTSLALLVGWLLTSAYFWRRLRNHPGPEHEEERPEPATKPSRLLSEVKLACQHGDARSTRALTVQWARLTWGNDFNGNLEDIAIRIDPDPFAQAIRNLDRFLYSSDSPGEAGWDGAEFAKAIECFRPQNTEGNHSGDRLLPNLYPTSV